MKICYFGIYNPDFGRNKVYIDALKKAGHSIIECRDESRGFVKYYHLWKKHRMIDHDYDVVIVGYPGHIVVPLARLISRKKVIVDALGSFYDAEVHSHSPTFFRKVKYWIADRLMVRFAHRILLESEAQKKFFEERFGISDKYRVVYTGVDEQFGMNYSVPDRVMNIEKRFIVLFRGRLTPECGIIHILKAAEILKDDVRISFKIIGFGYLLKETERFIEEHSLHNAELDSRCLTREEMIQQMIGANLMLGQFEKNPRLDRTIPHKAFEAFSMGIPYLSGDAPAIKEILIDGETGFFCALADSKALAKRIEELSVVPELLKKVAINAKKQFDSTFSSSRLAEEIMKAIML